VKKSNDQLLALLGSYTDQDRCDADEWWRTATLADKLRVWDRIQAKYDDPAMEIMSRFAQLAFAEMAQKHRE
jgi:hypothetical protein